MFMLNKVDTLQMDEVNRKRRDFIDQRQKNRIKASL